MEKSKVLQIALANVLVEKYWLKGLLSDDQKHRLCDLFASLTEFLWT